MKGSRGEKAIRYFDEDSTTMAVAAALATPWEPEAEREISDHVSRLAVYTGTYVPV